MTSEDVKRIRARSGKTLTEFGAMLGLSERTIRNWEGERGDRIPQAMELLLEAVEAVCHSEDNEAMIILRRDWLTRFA